MAGKKKTRQRKTFQRTISCKNEFLINYNVNWMRQTLNQLSLLAKTEKYSTKKDETNFWKIPEKLWDFKKEVIAF